jgi:hypothetical protein
MTNILWKYSLNAYSGFIEAEPSIADARKALIAKIAADPAALIGNLEPAEPSPHTIVDLGKRVFGMK